MSSETWRIVKPTGIIPCQIAPPGKRSRGEGCHYIYIHGLDLCFKSR